MSRKISAVIARALGLGALTLALTTARVGGQLPPNPVLHIDFTGPTNLNLVPVGDKLMVTSLYDESGTQFNATTGATPEWFQGYGVWTPVNGVGDVVTTGGQAFTAIISVNIGFFTTYGVYPRVDGNLFSQTSLPSCASTPSSGLRLTPYPAAGKILASVFGLGGFQSCQGPSWDPGSDTLSHLIRITKVNSTLSLYDGSTLICKTTSALATNPSLSSEYVYIDNPPAGFLQEFVFYNRSLSDLEIAAASTEISLKWGIPIGNTVNADPSLAPVLPTEPAGPISDIPKNGMTLWLDASNASSVVSHFSVQQLYTWYDQVSQMPFTPLPLANVYYGKDPLSGRGMVLCTKGDAVTQVAESGDTCPVLIGGKPLLAGLVSAAPTPILASLTSTFFFVYQALGAQNAAVVFQSLQSTCTTTKSSLYYMPADSLYRGLWSFGADTSCATIPTNSGAGPLVVPATQIIYGVRSANGSAIYSYASLAPLCTAYEANAYIPQSGDLASIFVGLNSANLMEIMSYDRLLSVSEINYVKEKLRSKWLTPAPPAPAAAPPSIAPPPPPAARVSKTSSASAPSHTAVVSAALNTIAPSSSTTGLSSTMVTVIIIIALIVAVGLGVFAFFTTCGRIPPELERHTRRMSMYQQEATRRMSVMNAKAPRPGAASAASNNSVASNQSLMISNTSTDKPIVKSSPMDADSRSRPAGPDGRPRPALERMPSAGPGMQRNPSGGGPRPDVIGSSGPQRGPPPGGRLPPLQGGGRPGSSQSAPRPTPAWKNARPNGSAPPSPAIQSGPSSPEVEPSAPEWDPEPTAVSNAED